MYSNARITLQLVKRDAKALKERLPSIVLDNIVLLSANVFLFGYLMPAIGMAQQLIASLFIGTILLSFFQVGFSCAVGLVEDLKFHRFIDYQRGLPLSMGWLLFKYVVEFTMNITVISLPTLLLGKAFLGKKFMVVSTNWPAFFLVYFLGTLLISSLFLYLSFAHEYHWFWSSVWSRRLDPLLLLGSIFVIWKKVYAFSPFWGTVLLMNPITYITEGMRTTLIGGDLFLPLWSCIGGISIGLIMTLFLLHRTYKKQWNGV